MEKGGKVLEKGVAMGQMETFEISFSPQTACFPKITNFVFIYFSSPLL